MSLFKPEIPLKEKVVSHHPWEKYIKDAYASTYKYGHNSAQNPIYPPKKDKYADSQRVKFTVIGNRVTKEFIYSINLVKGLHKYRSRYFHAPVIRGVTGVEWPKIWNDLKIKYGSVAYCLQSQVAVLINDEFLGGDKELKDLIEAKYVYHITPNYYGEAVQLFSNYIKSSGRPCAYLQISVDDIYIGTMIFMLYADIVPQTCENFLRFCNTKKGGYAGTPVHRIVKDSWIQCGGFGIKSTELDCENFVVPHDRRGVLGMANDGRHEELFIFIRHRNVDCSTQFFVLLQPATWMAHKYVAFGQLIDGEKTLQKIEQIPTSYESPTKRIIIFKCGILNLECQDIMINRGTNAYIAGHIENLFAIEETFYEELLEKVFLEVEFRNLQRHQAEIAGEGAEVAAEETAGDLRTTQRFMRKKEEIDKQIEKSKVRSGRDSPAVNRGENNEFDVEEYEYQPEEYSYHHVSVKASASIVVKPEKPFYIPLTDVPYPGEVDSAYDLKKLLRGDYCHEIDLDKDAAQKKESLEVPSEFLDTFFPTTPSEDSNSERTLDSEDEQEIKKYLNDNSDRVSFAGNIIKNIAKSAHVNVFKKERRNELITDENLRRFRLAAAHHLAHDEKTVTISLRSGDDLETKQDHTHKFRRVTGFVRKGDFETLLKFKHDSSELDEEEEEEDEEIPHEQETRKASIKPDKNKLAGYVPLGDLEKVHIFQKNSSDFAQDERGGTRNSNVDNDARKARQSVLARLFEDVNCEEDGKGPTLKDYISASQGQPMNSLFLTKSSINRIKDSDNVRDKFRRRDFLTAHGAKSIDNVLFLQHGKKVYRKISSDYVKTIGQIEHKQKNSIRTVEYAKTRPSITVREYQKKNQQYQENLMKSTTALANGKENREKINSTKNNGD